MKRHALVGTGGRAGMYIRALGDTWRADNALVALCDLSHTRMAWHNQRLQQQHDHPAAAHAYHADDFDKMIAEARAPTSSSSPPSTRPTTITSSAPCSSAATSSAKSP